MAYLRTIQVEGSEELLGIVTKINYSYPHGSKPSVINFYASKEDDANLYGTCTEEGIKHYNVNGGIFSDEYLKILEEKCNEVFSNYETI